MGSLSHTMYDHPSAAGMYSACCALWAPEWSPQVTALLMAASGEQDGELYGDGWTPLMAAAVADHCGIVMRLLTAAGPHAKRMAGLTNRNGLTAAHVAARRGCLPVLRALLSVGGGAIAATHDHMCK